MDQKVIDDLKLSQANIESLKSLLDRLYYHSEFGTVRTRPVISMLITACDYLTSNLGILAEQYRLKG